MKKKHWIWKIRIPEVKRSEVQRQTKHSTRED